MSQRTDSPSGEYPKREPVHVLDLQADGEKLVSQLPGNRRQGKNLARESGVSLVLTAMEQGDQMEEHRAPGVVTVQVLQGHITLSADEKEVGLKQGQMAMLQPGVTHTHRAHTQSLVLLTVTGASDQSGNPPPGEDYLRLQRACDNLGKVVDRDPGGRPEDWARELQDACRSMYDAISEHQDVAEGPDGAKAEIVTEKPGLMPRARRAVLEHLDMLDRAREIEEQIERQFAFHRIEVEPVRLKARVLRDIARLHLMRVDDLVYEAFYQEEGGEEG